MIDFLKKHNACDDDIEWATNSCRSLMDCWNKAKPGWLIWLATRDGVLTDRELHEFSLWSANQVRHLMTDPRSTAALDAKRGWLDGEVSDKELASAEEAAWAAAKSAAWAAESAAWAASKSAAWAAVKSAAWAAVKASWAAGTESLVAARESQAAWLRENTKPNFGEVE